MERRLIQQVVTPSFVTAIAIILSLLLASTQHYGPPTFRASIEFFLIFVLPLFPIIYGRITRDTLGATLMGVMPFLGVFSIILLGELDSFISFIEGLTRAVSFWFILIIIAGLEGYFASKERISSLFIAIGLYVTWILWFLSGIH
jgi:hypothetical protein